jgi:hypothetical protein
VDSGAPPESSSGNTWLGPWGRALPRKNIYDILKTLSPIGRKKAGQKPGIGKLVFVKLAAFGDAARDAVFPWAGSVPRAGGFVFRIGADTACRQSQGQTREEDREE